VDGHYRFRLNAFFRVSGLYLFAFFAWEGIAGAYKPRIDVPRLP
jgi:hypothetical protein